jgi:CheY-like chemotaxis protein
LTQNLLAFSRKQVMKTRVANLNEIVLHVQEFLGRIIGENIHLQSVLTDEFLLVDVDGGQIEQVLINLATNARDAMPKGGELTISTKIQDLDELFVQTYDYGKPGRYACISMSDTGVGMDEKTRQKIFEPFFTTKELGKGTGLGMSIVYGILKQHKGFINVYSEPNVGTTFRIYLPLVGSESAAGEQEANEVAPPGGTETILVAEDEADVRSLVEEILIGNGYQVILASDGRDAVAKFTAHKADIKLVLMDLVMPHLSGKEAGDLILQQNPEAKILFVSGYTMDIIKHRDLLGGQTELVMKPVHPTELLCKIRELLDR